MKEVLIFGSTGSIGKNALDIIRRDSGAFKVKGLMVNRNIGLLQKQVKEFLPSCVCVADDSKASLVRGKLPSRIKFFYGKEGVREFSRINADISVMGIVGVSALEPLLINLEVVPRMIMASKEPIVVAGDIVKAKVKGTGAELIPVDSEINALFQLFHGLRNEEVRKVYLTASGGPLYNYTEDELRKVTVSRVLSHPTWKMGQRITVDSATLVNKGFEVMETHFLFDVDYKDIEIVIQRQSQVHALIETVDHNFLACLYPPDMRIPLAFSLYYPSRCAFKKAGFPFYGLNISFEKLDRSRFPLLDIVLEAAERGDNFPVVVNAADEVAVRYFLEGKVGFPEIHSIVKNVYKKARQGEVADFSDVMYWDEWARRVTEEVVAGCG